MSVEEKQSERFNLWLSGGGKRFATLEAKAAYEARINRLKDAVQLKKTPDRVPVFQIFTFMPVTLFGSTPGEVMYDGKKLVAAWRRFLAEYEPDFYMSPAPIFYGPVLEALGYKAYKWPGYNLSGKSTYQYIEDEYMKAEEYPLLIDDPSDFLLRRYLPRICESLGPFKDLLPLTGTLALPTMVPFLVRMGSPQSQSALKAMIEASRAAFEWFSDISAFEDEAQQSGFVNGFGGSTRCPFDLIGDTLRGTRGIILDMYRNPGQLLKALERITPLMIKAGLTGPNQSGNPVVFIPIHKGADGSMSDDQFKTFYWPFLKEVIFGLVNEGCVPLVTAEGSYNSRIPYLRDLPKGHCIWMFDRTDMAEAKKMIGEIACIGGNVPVSAMLTGTPEEVRTICKNLIDVAGRNGGYIMSCGSSMDEAKADTLHAMIDFTKEYGIYRQAGRT
jgi:uroporphyrinogen-III decarboxylase